MAVFITGPPGNTFLKTAIFYARYVINRRLSMATNFEAFSGRFREFLRGLIVPLGMVKSSQGF